MTVSCFIDQVIDDNKVVSKTRTTLHFLLHRRELRMLCCSRFLACVSISGNLLTLIWDIVAGTI